MSTEIDRAGEQERKGTADAARAAANIQVTICSYVLTAGLAVIAAEAGLGTFYLEHRSLALWAAIALGVAPVLVIIGFILGGSALNAISEDGYDGKWDTFYDVSGKFNWQATCTLVGALMVLVVAVWGSTPTDVGAQKQIEALRAQVTGLRRTVNSLQDEVCREAPKRCPARGGSHP